MRRIKIPARPDWQARVERQGLPFHSSGTGLGGEHVAYWDETAYYQLTAGQVDDLEAATEELHARCLDVVKHVCRNPELLNRLGVPEAYHSFVVDSWRRRDPHVYGRFDLVYDGENPPKMLEYNADTPTTLIETAVVQWYWLEDVFKDDRPDQFCSAHEKLIARWKSLRPHMRSGSTLYFASLSSSIEEYATVEYLRDTTEQAGLPTKYVGLEKLRWDFDRKKFVDEEGSPIDYLFRLYPWEWMFDEEFGKYLPETSATTGFIEPPWKAILSNKGILPILWELFPDHPNLLPAYWEPDARLGDKWIAKPLVGREGRNMTVYADGKASQTSGPYGSEPKVYQAFVDLPTFDGQRAIVGSWVVGDSSAGICIREDEKPIVNNLSRIVPHVFS